MEIINDQDFTLITEVMTSCGYRSSEDYYASCKELKKFSESSLKSIWCQEAQRQAKKYYWKAFQKDNVDKYWMRYKELQQQTENDEQSPFSNSPGVIQTIAKEANVADAFMARWILQRWLEEHCPGEASRAALKLCFMKPMQYIRDVVLAHEVWRCLVADLAFGPYAEQARRSSGISGEIKMEAKLRHFGVKYFSEDKLREKGYDKTPDYLLEYPVSIEFDDDISASPADTDHEQAPAEVKSKRSLVVCWFESKALFGDPVSHAGYYENQYHRYVHRFGPGLVIYWCGYVLNAAVEKHAGQSVHCAAAFPHRIWTLEQALLGPIRKTEGCRGDSDNMKEK